MTRPGKSWRTWESNPGYAFQLDNHGGVEWEEVNANEHLDSSPTPNPLFFPLTSPKQEEPLLQSPHHYHTDSWGGSGACHKKMKVNKRINQDKKKNNKKTINQKETNKSKPNRVNSMTCNMVFSCSWRKENKQIHPKTPPLATLWHQTKDTPRPPKNCNTKIKDNTQGQTMTPHSGQTMTSTPDNNINAKHIKARQWHNIKVRHHIEANETT